MFLVMEQKLENENNDSQIKIETEEYVVKNWYRDFDKKEKEKAEKVLKLVKEKEKKLNKKPIKIPQGYSPSNNVHTVNLSMLNRSYIHNFIKESLSIAKVENKKINFDFSLNALEKEYDEDKLKEIFIDECMKNKISIKRI